MRCRYRQNSECLFLKMETLVLKMEALFLKIEELVSKIQLLFLKMSPPSSLSQDQGLRLRLLAYSVRLGYSNISPIKNVLG